MSQASLRSVFETLADRFTAAFPTTIDGPRTIGREAEYPIVTVNGVAADLRRLWAELMAPGDLKPKYGPSIQDRDEMIVGLDGEDFSYALEVGIGTVEVNTRPCADLFEIAHIMDDAVGRLVRAAARFGWRVLAYGIQPVSPPSLKIIAPKQRYMSLYRAMGATWLWYTVTASDQVQIALTRDEMVFMLNYGSLMTPVIIALCANSPIFGNQLSPYCSAREGQMSDIYAQEHRHGMLARPMGDIVDFVRTMSESTYLIVRDDNEVIPSSQPFMDYLAEHGADYDAFLFHEHYMWNSARLRATFGTIEIRPACQQPWVSGGLGAKPYTPRGTHDGPEHMAVSALGLGLIEAARPIQAYVEASLGPGYWAIMQTYHTQTIRHGLRAPEPAPDFLANILTLAEEGLCARGFGEEGMLVPLWRRHARGRNPAQRNRAVYHTDGIRGLIARTTIRPGMIGQNV